MAESSFDTNLLRFIAAHVVFSNVMAASREMYGKGYFSLGLGEKVAVDQAVAAHVGANFPLLTADYLKGRNHSTTSGFPN